MEIVSRMLGGVRIAWLLVGVLAVILIPFFLFESQMTDFAAWVVAQRGAWWVGPMLALLLGADVVLPVPSSIVSTASGYLLGFFGGALGNVAGMTAGCWVGYVLSRSMGHRLLSGADRTRVEAMWARYGEWTVVITRAVPVLAEASVLFAGIVGMERRRFFLLTTLANAGVGVLYAAIGAYAMQWDSFVTAFVASLVLPGAAMGIMRWKWPKS